MYQVTLKKYKFLDSGSMQFVAQDDEQLNEILKLAFKHFNTDVAQVQIEKKPVTA